MAQPQPATPNYHYQNDSEGESSNAIAVLIDRIESFRRPRKLYGRELK